MITKVWAVVDTKDYNCDVLALFTTEEEALSAQAMGLGDDITPYDVYSAGEFPQRVTHWKAWIDRRDSVVKVRSYETWDCVDKPPVTVRVQAGMSGYNAYGSSREDVINAVVAAYGRPVTYA